MNKLRLAEVIIILGSVLLSSCHYGRAVKDFPPANGPQGVGMQVTTDHQMFLGELLEVRDIGLIVLSEKKIHLLPFAEITSSQAVKTSSQYSFGGRRQPSPEVRERLRLVSRFPQGLTPDLLRRLLETYGQTELAGANR
jgi:hypothetical protein